MSPHVGTRRAHTWPRWALWALMSGAQRATSDIWKARDGRSVAHLFDAPDRTPLQKAHHYRQLARSWHAHWCKSPGLANEASGPGPLSPLFQQDSALGTQAPSSDSR